MITKLVVSFWFRAVLSTTIVIYLVSQFDRQETIRTLLTVDIFYFLLALVVDVVTRATMVVRWTVLLQSSATPVSIWTAARIFLITSFVGTALPAGGADVTRAYTLSRYTDDGSEAIASVAVDRLLGVSALLVLAVLGLILWTGTTTPLLARLVVGLSVLTAIALLGAFWASEVLRRVVPPALRRTSLSRWLIEVADSVARYRGRRGVLLTVFGLSVVVQWLRILEVFLLGGSLGIPVDLSYYLVFMPMGLLVFMLPVSIAGIGLPQGAIVWLLRPAGVPDVQAFALSTLFVVVGLIGTLPGLWLYLRSRGD